VEWRWEPIENLPAMIVPFKRPVYERVVHEFAPFASGAVLRGRKRSEKARNP
jgi:putative (di)nucleoside polyphosphate hydrolase